QSSFKETLRPVTIRQLNTAHLPHPEADFKIDDVEVTQLTFVGQIRNISTQATNVTYKLDDGTGTIEVKQWVELGAIDQMDTTTTTNGNRAAGSNKLTENEYCRVWGRLKVFGNNKRHVGAHIIRPVTDKMEIMYHLLEATYVHLYFTRGPPELKGESRAGENAYMKSEADDSNVMGGGGRQTTMPSVSNSARRVYQCLKSEPQSNEGLHVQNIAAKLAMAVPEVMKAGDELLTHSMIFTTVDDSTWALLEF
ncbi:MAG: hypothetical protein Q9190_003878, partial [Brigantiaea leucoxantha]